MHFGSPLYSQSVITIYFTNTIALTIFHHTKSHHLSTRFFLPSWSVASTIRGTYSWDNIYILYGVVIWISFLHHNNSNVLWVTLYFRLYSNINNSMYRGLPHISLQRIILYSSNVYWESESRTTRMQWLNWILVMNISFKFSCTFYKSIYLLHHCFSLAKITLFLIWEKYLKLIIMKFGFRSLVEDIDI